MKSKYLFAMIERNIFTRKGFIVAVFIIKFDKNMASYLWRSGLSLPCSEVSIGIPRRPHYFTQNSWSRAQLTFLLHLYIINFSYKAFHPDSSFQLCIFHHIIFFTFTYACTLCKHLLLYPNTVSTAHFLPDIKSIQILTPI